MFWKKLLIITATLLCIVMTFDGYYIGYTRGEANADTSCIPLNVSLKCPTAVTYDNHSDDDVFQKFFPNIPVEQDCPVLPSFECPKLSAYECRSGDDWKVKSAKRECSDGIYREVFCQ